MRDTKQRKLILDIINNSTNHLSANEVYYEARKVINNISLGTVYRNLNKLVLDNLIIRLKTNEGLDRFDNTLKKHHHFVCCICNKVSDVFDEVDLKIKVPNGKIMDYEVKFKGICSDCLKKEE